MAESIKKVTEETSSGEKVKSALSSTINKAKQYENVYKIGRTQLQDAVPMKVGNTGTFNAKTIEGYTLKSPTSGSITTTYEEETKTIVFIYTKNLPPKEEGIVPPQTGLDGVKYYGIYSIKYLVLLILVAARLKYKRA